MSRKKRIYVPHLFYHIGCRGNRRESIFRDEADIDAFFHILYELHDQFHFEIASYCLMTNHYHLLIRSQEVPISKLMSFINKRYADYNNTKYNLTGHVFEKRFHDNIILDRKEMLDVCRYIHMNPVEAGMVKSPELYPWSSCHLFKDPMAPQPVFMNIDSLLDLFAGSTEEKRKLFWMVMNFPETDKEEDLIDILT
ncbi:transposase [Bacillus salipaludis]|uniref:REP-associated tyrosine transposase n=1 Tax=Bacillus salipaludis TaxID=2547811 RepID=UPI003D1C064A